MPQISINSVFYCMPINLKSTANNHVKPTRLEQVFNRN